MSDTPEKLHVVFAGRRDDECDQRLMETLLSATARLHFAESADETLQICSSQLPDMVVARQVEGFDAFDLTARLRSLVKPPHVILVGDNDDATAWRMALDSGAAAYIPAHRVAEELAKAIARTDHAIALTRGHRLSFAKTDRTARIFESLPLGILLVDGTGSVASANHSFIAMTGLSAENLKGIKLKSLLAQILEDRFARTRELLDASRQGVSWSGECRCYYSNNREGWAAITISPLAHPDENPWSVMTIRDISETRRATNRLLTEKGAAHDLLSAQGYAAPEDLHRLNSMLLGGADVALEEATFNLKDLLSRSLCRDISLDISSSIPEHLKGMRLELGAAIRALAVWGRRNSKNGMAALSVTIRQRNGKSWQLLFTMFSEDNQITENSYESADDHLLHHKKAAHPAEVAGIGLASWLVTLLGGSMIIMKTSKNEGRRASFSLWLEEDSSHVLEDTKEHDDTPFQPWHGEQSGEKPEKPLRVLLAEDSPIDQANIKNLMQRLGYEIIAAENGHEAVEECEHNDFDLILMDILMPVMDGFEASRLIREREALSGRRTPIIALTSYSLKAVQEKCQRVGMNGYLPKPVSMTSLRKVMETIPKAVVTVQENEISQAIQSDNSLQVLNSRHAIEFIEGNTELYRELIDLFILHAPKTMEELVEALLTENSDAIEKASHKMKGMAANIGAEKFSASNRQLMDLARDGKLTDCKEWLKRLQGEFALLEKVLLAY